MLSLCSRLFLLALPSCYLLRYDAGQHNDDLPVISHRHFLELAVCFLANPDSAVLKHHHLPLSGLVSPTPYPLRDTMSDAIQNNQSFAHAGNTFQNIISSSRTSQS